MRKALRLDHFSIRALLMVFDIFNSVQFNFIVNLKVNTTLCASSVSVNKRWKDKINNGHRNYLMLNPEMTY